MSAVFDIALADDATPEEQSCFLPFLENAAPGRRSEFYAGRRCAGMALALSGADRSPVAVPVGENRAPCWPDGIVGSITHTSGYAAAAVAQITDVRGLGLDTEALIAETMVQEVGDRIALPQEIACVRRALAVDEPVAWTLAFSAKESVYKAVFSLMKRSFTFLDVELIAIRADPPRAELRFNTAVANDLHPGTRLTAHFAIEPSRVHTGVLIRSRATESNA